MVNGPEGDASGWLSVDGQLAEDDVRRLRQRIFTATQAGDLARVRNLQKLMLRSRANALMSVRRVMEINAGRETAGVDGKTALLAPEKADLADWVQHRSGSWTPRPVKRAFVPKANGRRRPLGIPVIADRALQAVVLGALEPEWEARFEPKSYGFRPGRGCHDAIEAIFGTVVGRNPHRRWILDADLAAAFDTIDHQRLLAALGSFSARDMIAGWLKAGVIENGTLTPTREGTPQGGVVSPLMMNVALHGLEAAAGVRYYPDGRKDAGKSVPGSPVVVRYADDLVALCVSAEQARQVKDRLAQWLAPRGLAFNEDKTRIVRLEDGFDFLGFSIRRYRNGKLLIKPGKAAVQRIRSRLAAEVRALHGANAEAVINALNPVIRAGRPTTAPWSPRRSSPAWTTTCGGSPTGGRCERTRTSRNAGLQPGTSARSTRPGGTTGCSATAPAAVTWSSSPGHRLSGTAWSQAARHPTTPPWPATGPSGGGAGDHPWARSCCGCSSRRTDAAQAAAACCCTQPGNRKAPMSGNYGSRGCARRSAARRSPPPAGHRTKTHAA